MADITNNFLRGIMNKDLDETLVPNGAYRDALNVEITNSEGDDSGIVRNIKGNTQEGDLNTVAQKIVSFSVAATATIVGTSSLNGASGTSLILINSDGSTVTFTTDPTLNFGNVSASIGDNTWRVNTKDISGGNEVRKATQAIHIAVLAAIAAGELDMTVVPATNTGTQTSFLLTQNNNGTIGNTAITLMTGATSTGGPSFTQGADNTKNARTIGAISSESDNSIYYLVASDELDGIFEYNETSGNVTRVLQSNKSSASDITKLNFNQSYYVTGINYVDGFLYWTDNLNPPRRINISRAKSYAIDDIRIDDDISVILEPPLNAPMIDMFKVSSQENNLEETFVQFAYRFKYIDNQYSSMSPFSGIAFVPSTYVIDFAIGENKGMINSKNKVNISFETGNRFVEAIELIMRDTRSIKISVVEIFEKKPINIDNNSVHTYEFSNNKIYRALPEAQLSRLFDNVPLKAKAQAFIDKRIVYGNYEESYNISDSSGQEIPLDYSVKYVSKDTSEGVPIQTFRSDRDYEIGIQYGDKYGRFSTVLTCPTDTGSPTVYIPASQSTKGNSLCVQINNKPPSFATCYRLVIKQNKGIYYNIFPVKYYVSGLYRYFNVNDFDRDKVRAGDYIIFKSTVNGATLTNKKYKVLEVEHKTQVDIITGIINSNGAMSGGTQNVIPGLYFKIKVDQLDEFPEYTSNDYTYIGSGGNIPSVLLTSTTSTTGVTFNGVPTNTIGSPVLPLSVIPEEFYPVHQRFSVAEDPIYYPVNGGSATSGSNISVLNNEYTSPGQQSGIYMGDLRLSVEIFSSTQFRYTFEIPSTSSSSWTIKTIPFGSTETIEYNNYTVLTLSFSSGQNYNIGDQYKISCRGDGHFTQNYFGGEGIPKTGNELLAGEWFGCAVFPGPSFSDNDPNYPETDKAIEIGSEITMKFTGPGVGAAPLVFPPSEAKYENIEEWFVESGAFNLFMWDASSSTLGNGQVVLPYGNGPYGPETVTFRRGSMKEFSLVTNGGGKISQGGTNFTNVGGLTISNLSSVTKDYPVKMIVSGRGYITHSESTFPGFGPGVPTDYGSINVNITIKSNSGAIAQAETTPGISDADIYHETTRTYPISNSLHKVLWNYKAFYAHYVDITNENPLAGNYVGLGQVLNQIGSEPTGIDPHVFQIGDQVEVHSTATPALAGTHTVIDVIDKYNIVISLAYPGGASASVGGVGFYHAVMEEKDQTNPSPAEILINPTTNTNSTYNAYSFGNGLESDRIRDAFNMTTIEYSPRASTNIQGYDRKRKDISITYSGTYTDKTSTNSLNEFNLSLVNFKNLDAGFGSIQKIHARNTDLLVFQEDKISRVLYGKNLLSDAVGGGAVTATPKVLGGQISDTGEWGISFNPESFAEWGNKIYWADSRRGAILSMEGQSIMPISDMGMKSYFKDLMKNNRNTQKIGVFDASSRSYVLASNEETSRPCNFSLNVSGADYPSNIINQVGVIGKYDADFIVFSNTTWTAAIAYSAGSNWVTGWPATGHGDQAVDIQVANNTTLAVRTATITFTFCGNQTVTYTVTQAAGTNITIHPWVIGGKPIIHAKKD